MQIRTFTFSTSDYTNAISLRNKLYPDNPSTVAIWKHNDVTRRQDPSYHFFVAENGQNEIQAFIQCALNHPKSKKLTFGLIANRVSWENGTADDLMCKLVEVAGQLSAEKLICKIQENDEPKISYLAKQGFVTVMRYPISALDVASFKSEPFQSKINPTSPFQRGIEIKQLPDGWQQDHYWQQFVHELDWVLMQDVPSHEPRIKKSLETFLNEEIFHPNSMPESYFIAWDGDKAVGLTCFVMRGGRKETVSTAITGVIRSHRRRGIARALKIESIKFAQRTGVKTILTNNEENNPMFLLNQELGFKQKPAWVNLEKPL